VKHLQERYIALLADANLRTNLVSRRLNKEGIAELVAGFSETLDRAAVPPKGTLLDIGSGGGLPGIPLAIEYPGLTVFLNESRKLRLLELEKFVRSLALENTFVIPGRAENLPSLDVFSDGVDIVTAFGVGKAVAVFDLVMPLLAVEGVALLSIPAKPSRQEVAEWHLQAAIRGFRVDVHESILQGGRSLLRLLRFR